jgi:hypothetical protein
MAHAAAAPASNRRAHPDRASDHRGLRAFVAAAAPGIVAKNLIFLCASSSTMIGLRSRLAQRGWRHATHPPFFFGAATFSRSRPARPVRRDRRSSYPALMMSGRMAGSFAPGRQHANDDHPHAHLWPRSHRTLDNLVALLARCRRWNCSI